MLKMLSIKLSYWHLMSFFILLPLKFQLSAVPTVHVILAPKEIAKGTIHPRQPTKTHRHSRCIAVLPLTSLLDGMGGQHRTLAA
jgi:hypothetical protein